MPRELVVPLTDALARGHGLSLRMLAARGGISVFELLLLLPPPEGTDAATHQRNVCDLTLSQAMNALAKELAAFHARREAEAEAAMLAAMEEGTL